MSNWHVVTTINEPSAIIAATRGDFLEPQKENLITCKGSTIEIYSVMLDGLKLLLQFDIFGTISNIEVIQMPVKKEKKKKIYNLRRASYFFFKKK